MISFCDTSDCGSVVEYLPIHLINPGLHWVEYEAYHVERTIDSESVSGSVDSVDEASTVWHGSLDS